MVSYKRALLASVAFAAYAAGSPAPAPSGTGSGDDYGVGDLLSSIISAIEGVLSSGVEDLLKGAADAINSLAPEIANVVLAITSYI